jgi:hypothetical protein
MACVRGVVDPAELARGCPTAWNGQRRHHHWISVTTGPRPSAKCGTPIPTRSSPPLPRRRRPQKAQGVHRQRPLAVLRGDRQLRLNMLAVTVHDDDSKTPTGGCAAEVR